MNRNELEQWMKDTLGEQPFTPDEKSWAKLQSSLPGQQTPAEKGPHKNILLAAPLWIKAAAAVLLLVSGTLYYSLNNDDSAAHRIAESGSNTAPGQTGNNSENKRSQNPVADRITENNEPAVIAANSPLGYTVAKPAHSNQTTPVKYPKLPEQSHRNDQPVIVTRTEPTPNTPNTTIQEEKVATTRKGDPVPFPDFTPQEKTPVNPLNIGVAAQFGRATVGNMQYQVGLVAHKDISNRFYAEATLAVAATDVRYSHDRSFTGFSSDGLTNAITYDEKVSTQYGKNVVSMGISPGIGYRLTRQLAIAAGAAVYRNLNESLSLKNQGSFGETALKNEVVSGTQPINQWDLGITGNASFNVSHKLSINAQYRYGLSTYMELNNQQIRNSGMNLGLKYLFGK